MKRPLEFDPIDRLHGDRCPQFRLAAGSVGRESPSGAATDKPPAASPSSGRAHNLNSLGLSEVDGSWDLELRELANAELGYAISMPSAWREVHRDR